MINQLIEKIRRTGAPIVAGLDPVLKFVPEHIKQKAYAEYGETMKERQRRSGCITRRSWMPSTI